MGGGESGGNGGREYNYVWVEGMAAMLTIFCDGGIDGR
ncbi:hypothetical protein T06_15724, partial [Trichinella sp. T6]